MVSSDDDWRIAVMVEPSLSLGELANTIAALAVGLGAAAPHLAGDTQQDATKRCFHVIANRAIPVLQAPAEVLRSLFLKATSAPSGAIMVPFPRFARQIHAYADYAAELTRRDLATEMIDGVGFAGPGKWVRSMTGSLKLLR
jgi:hypothetical protein